MEAEALVSPTAGSAVLEYEEAEPPPLSLRALVWRRFRRHRMAMAALFVLGALVLYSTLGSLFFSEAYANATVTGRRLQPPSLEHPFGTDTVGRDILARTIYGGQISLLIGLFAVGVEVLDGISVA